MHLVGEGPERERLERIVAELDLGDVVTFEGFVPDAAGRFADAQFSVLPSHNEGLPNAVLESMAYGVPVIATAVAGVPELIDDDVDGLLVTPGDSKALAAAIERLTADPTLRVRLGAAARGAWSGTRGTAAPIATSTVYRRVLDERHRGRARRRRPLMRILFATGSLDIGGAEAPDGAPRRRS